MLYPVTLWICTGLIAMAVIFCFLRLLKGPGILDRAQVLEVFSLIGICFLAIDAVSNHQKVLLDTMIVIAIVPFVGSVAVTTFLIKTVNIKKRK